MCNMYRPVPHGAALCCAMLCRAVYIYIYMYIHVCDNSNIVNSNIILTNNSRALALCPKLLCCALPCRAVPYGAVLCHTCHILPFQPIL